MLLHLDFVFNSLSFFRNSLVPKFRMMGVVSNILLFLLTEVKNIFSIVFMRDQLDVFLIFLLLSWLLLWLAFFIFKSKRILTFRDTVCVVFMIFGLDELESSIFFFLSIHLIPGFLLIELDCSLIR